MGYRCVRIHSTARIAPNCSIVGTVDIGAEASVFSGAALRGDWGSSISIGARTNVQENCIFHVNATSPLIVGEGVTVGHGAILHGCTVGNNTLIGMGAIVLDDARVGSNCLIGAGSLVTQGTEIPDGTVAFGSPARVRRTLTEDEIATLRKDADEYAQASGEMVEAGLMMWGDSIPADHPTIALAH